MLNTRSLFAGHIVLPGAKAIDAVRRGPVAAHAGVCALGVVSCCRGHLPTTACTY